MIRSIFLLISFVITVLFSPDRAFSQQDDSRTLFLKVDYFKAAGQQMSQYLELELEQWKPMHEERFKRDIIKSWDFYSVVAAEPDAPYNFITINVFDDFSLIDYYDLDSIINSVYPDKDPDELMEQTRNSREVVRTEIWEVNGRIMNDGQQAPGGSYLTINYFNSRGGSGEHEEMELGFWGQIHETRIEHEILNSWAMYTLLYPGGDVRNYTYSTIDYYDSLGDLREPVGMALARVAHPDLSDEEINDLFTRTGDSRTLFKTELWKRIGHIGPAADE
jgi:hypothetical protein